MSQRCGVGQIVHANDFNIGIVPAHPVEVPADTTETVDTYLDCHANLLEI